MERSPSLSAKPVLLLLTGAFITAWGPTLVRISDLEPTATAFWRLALAAPFLALLAMLSGRSGDASHPVADLRVFLWTGLAFALDLVCWHASIRLTTIANASLFANFAPLIVALVSWLYLGERFRPGFWWGLILALAGAGLLVSEGLSVDSSRSRGDALGFATAGFYAAYIFGMSRLRSRYRVTLVMAWVTVASAGFVLLAAWLLGESIWPGTRASWWPLLLLALGPQVLGQGSIAYALAFLPAAFGAVNLLFQPVVATLIAWLLLSEGQGPVELLGIVAVLLGIGTANRSRA